MRLNSRALQAHTGEEVQKIRCSPVSMDSHLPQKKNLKSMYGSKRRQKSVTTASSQSNSNYSPYPILLALDYHSFKRTETRCDESSPITSGNSIAHVDTNGYGHHILQKKRFTRHRGMQDNTWKICSLSGAVPQRKSFM